MITPDGKKAYVGNRASADSTVSIIDTENNSFLHSISFPKAADSSDADPVATALSSDGKKLYVSLYSLNSIAAIDTSDDRISKTFSVGTPASGLSFSPDGSRAFVTHVFSNSVFVVDALNDAVDSTVPALSVGLYPYGIAYSPAGRTVYVANQGGNTVSVLSSPAFTSNAVPARGKVGQDYPGYQIQATGTGTVFYSATDLPSGLSLDAGTGLISGTPTAPGSSTAHVTVSGVVQPPASVDLVFVIDPDAAPTPGPTISPLPAPNTTGGGSPTPTSAGPGTGLANTGPGAVGLLGSGAVVLVLGLAELGTATRRGRSTLTADAEE